MSLYFDPKTSQPTIISQVSEAKALGQEDVKTHSIGIGIVSSIGTFVKNLIMAPFLFFVGLFSSQKKGM